MDYFKLLCWIFCVWDLLILIALVAGFFVIRAILSLLRTIDDRHTKEVALQQKILKYLSNERE